MLEFKPLLEVTVVSTRAFSVNFDEVSLRTYQVWTL